MERRRMMKLIDFLDIYTRSNRAVVLCDSRAYDDMFDTIDLLNNKGETKLSDLVEICEYTICVFHPQYTEYRSTIYLRDEWLNASVTHFFIGDEFIVIWVNKKDEEDAE